ncbi:MAG TPA: hypothetical protein VI197_27615 [Polyangiaceae bacterium]
MRTAAQQRVGRTRLLLRQRLSVWASLRLFERMPGVHLLKRARLDRLA